ncbi:MAG: AtpZ/AtpI family protein [Alphaproteobacteria bacterium]|nr:AtpZ/AtpI family protein [Alphaproteobacteria bacterium]
MTDDEKLRILSAKIDSFKQREESEKTAQSRETEERDNMNRGMRAGVELLVTIGAGTFIGLMLDNTLGTKPVFLIIFLLGGIAAGFMNLYRIMGNFDSAVGFRRLPEAEKDATKGPETTPDSER